MSRKYEVAIKIQDKDYVDQLIVALVRQGYSVYYNPECDINGYEVVCFTGTDDEILEIKQ